MKTAYEVLRAHDTTVGDYTPFKIEDIERAMIAFAKSAIEEDRKDAAEAAMEALHDEGIYGYGPAIKEGITDRPLPNLK